MRGTFAVNVLSDRQAALAETFAGRGERPHTFAERDWSPLVDGAPPLLHGAAARFRCDVAALHTAGTHTLVLGAVTRAERGAATAARLHPARLRRATEHREARRLVPLPNPALDAQGDEVAGAGERSLTVAILRRLFPVLPDAEATANRPYTAPGTAITSCASWCRGTPRAEPSDSCVNVDPKRCRDGEWERIR